MLCDYKFEHKKANITVGQLVAMFPIIKQDLQRGLNAHCIKTSHKKEVHLVEVVCHGILLKGILVDGRIRMNVMTISTMETLGLQCDCLSKCNLHMANKERVKLKRVITTFNISDFQVIRSVIRAHPMVFGSTLVEEGTCFELLEGRIHDH